MDDEIEHDPDCPYMMQRPATSDSVCTCGAFEPASDEIRGMTNSPFHSAMGQP